MKIGTLALKVEQLYRSGKWPRNSQVFHHDIYVTEESSTNQSTDWVYSGTVPWSDQRSTTTCSKSSMLLTYIPSRHRLRSSTSDDLIVSAVRLTSIGSRAFPVAACPQMEHPTTAPHLCLIVDCRKFSGMGCTKKHWPNRNASNLCSTLYLRDIITMYFWCIKIIIASVYNLPIVIFCRFGRFYRASACMVCRARYCFTISVCLSDCPSMCRYSV